MKRQIYINIFISHVLSYVYTKNQIVCSILQHVVNNQLNIGGMIRVQTKIMFSTLSNMGIAAAAASGAFIAIAEEIQAERVNTENV